MMESGVTGLLFTPRDVETLTSYMVRLVENPAFRRKLGENFYEKASRFILLKRRSGTSWIFTGPFSDRRRVRRKNAAAS